MAERMVAFVRRYRLGAAERDTAGASPELRSAAEAEAARYRRALDGLEALGGDVLAAFRVASEDRGVALLPSAATHAVLPLVATAPARRLQVDAGLRSHRRRFGAADGFWLPECAYRPDVEPFLAERGLRFFCVDQSAFEDGLARVGPSSLGGGLGRIHARLGRRPARLVRARISVRPVLCGVPSAIARGKPPVVDRRGPYDAEAATQRADRHAREFARGDRGPPRRLSRATREAGAGHVRRGHRAPGPLVVGGPRLARGGREPGRRAGRSPRHAPPGSRTAPAGGATAARVDLGRGQGPPHLGLA